MKTRTLISNLVFIIAATSMGGSALAQGGAVNPAAMSAAKQACSEDVQKFCSDVAPGGGRIMMCLQKNSDSLSSGCQTVVSKAKAAAAARKANGGSN